MVFDYFDRMNYSEFDFELRATRPHLMYLIAACHRSGSTWLALRLWQTQHAGAPWEYFNEVYNLRPLATRFGAQSAREYIQALFQHRTSPNGVFGLKVLLNQWPIFSECWSESGERFSEFQVIFVDRRDKIRQAVSYAKAVLTRQWSTLTVPRCEPRYSADLIKRAYTIVSEQPVQWDEIFSSAGWQPTKVFYEDLVSDFDGELQRLEVLRHLDLRPRAQEFPKIDPQSDSKSEMWSARFLAEETDWLNAMNA